MSFSIWMALGISLLIQLLLFTFAYLFKTDKLTDFSYGLTFIILALIGYLYGANNISKIILLSMIIIWALRLIYYLVIRIKKIGRDKRFDGVRENFKRFLAFWFYQGVVVWLVMVPSLLFFNSSGEIGYLGILGIIIWFSGLLIEGFSDQQKFKFKNNVKNKGKWIQTGLWNYSRHPNYFGEDPVWLGLYIYTLQGIGSWWYFGIISPLIIYVILRYGSGIPTLERKYDKIYAKNKEYQKYKKKTNLLIVWFKRK